MIKLAVFVLICVVFVFVGIPVATFLGKRRGHKGRLTSLLVMAVFGFVAFIIHQKMFD